jgi:CheY-like chemotaxis protein
MTGLRRTLGLCVALAAFQAPAWAFRPDELQDTFKNAVEMLQRGHKEDALKALQKVVAMNPDQKAAYELWTTTDYVTWRDFLVEGGEFELSAKRLISLASIERAARRNDKDAILKLVQDATTNTDVIERRKSVRTLSADHGEYAVPYLLPLIVEQGNDDRIVLAMHTLAQMSSDVVVPLLEALNSDNAVLRRNIALVLGNIGDPRAAGSLQWLAAHDADETVKTAATDSLAKMGAKGDAISNFLAAGQAYYERNDSALRHGESGDVIWDWKDGKLNALPIARGLYGSEMSKRSYFQALHADPSSTPALAGLARAYVEMQTKIDAMTAGGQDAGEWKNKAGEALTAINASGSDALDMALGWAVQNVDSSTGAALCKVLAPLAKAPTAGLEAALKSADGAIRSEAGVALGKIAVRTRTAAGPAVVASLGDSAAREALRIAMVIDGNAQASAALATALEAKGVFVNAWSTGAKGLGMLHRSPVLDLIVVADSLPDITTAQVIDDVRHDERMAQVPIVVSTKDDATVTANFGDRIQGTMKAADDMTAIDAALSKEMSGDRALAENLAARASEVLHQLAQAGTDDLGSVLASLVKATGRGDKISIPAMMTLGQSGGAAEAGALVAVLADDKRSEDARVAAGRSLSSLVGRLGTALDAELLAKVKGVIDGSAGSMAVREAAAQVIGSLPMNATERAELIRKLRG